MAADDILPGAVRAPIIRVEEVGMHPEIGHCRLPAWNQGVEEPFTRPEARAARTRATARTRGAGVVEDSPAHVRLDECTNGMSKSDYLKAKD